MKRLLILLLFATAVMAGEPRAIISGPTTGVVGEKILLDVSGSVSDPEFPLQVDGIGPEKPSVRVWFDEQARPGLVVLQTSQPGNYSVAVAAMGKVNDSQKTIFRFSVWVVQVNSGPAPKPPPKPQPDPVDGKLWGMLILPALPSVMESSLRTSRIVRKAFADNKVYFGSYLSSEIEVQTPERQAAITAVGGPPCMLWINESGKIIQSTKVLGESSLAADVQTIRGAR